MYKKIAGLLLVTALLALTVPMGVFVGGANLEVVNEDEAKTAILDCKLAK